MNKQFETAPFPVQLPEVTRTVIRQMSPGLPVPDLVSYYVLEKERVIYLEHDVDDKIMNIQRMILRWNMEDRQLPAAERKPICLYIFSYGGDSDYMWALVDTIEASETPVYTINAGMAASAAGIIYLAGHRRYMLPRSKLLIHEGSARMAGDAVKVIDAGESYKKMVKQMKEYVLSRTAISAAALNKQRCHDWELDAAYCLEHGVCDAVIRKLSEVL